MIPPPISSLRGLLGPFASKRMLAVTLILAVSLGGVSWYGWNAYRLARLPGAPATPAQIEATWGIRVTQLVVTGDGGMVDFRFVVVDPEKAGPLMTTAKRPRLIVEDTGAAVDSLYHGGHGGDLLPGQTHFLLYNNTGGAIQSGVAVSVLLGDLRLEHVIAK